MEVLSMPNVNFNNMIVLDRGIRLSDLPKTKAGEYILSIPGLNFYVPESKIPVYGMDRGAIGLATIRSITMNATIHGILNTDVAFVCTEITEGEQKAYNRLFVSDEESDGPTPSLNSGRLETGRNRTKPKHAVLDWGDIFND